MLNPDSPSKPDSIDPKPDRQTPDADSTVKKRAKTLHKPSAVPAKTASELISFGSRELLGLGPEVDLMDVGTGKDGVMSVEEADALERRVMESVVAEDGKSLWEMGSENTKVAFLVALRVYLAMHSSENADDGSGAASDGVKLQFGPTEMLGSELKVAAGVKSFNRYLRCRADEVSTSIRFILNRAKQPGAAAAYPNACSTARLLQVNARKRYVEEYPHLAFVGAEYCSSVTPRVAEVLEEAKRAILGEASVSSSSAGRWVSASG